MDDNYEDDDGNDEDDDNDHYEYDDDEDDDDDDNDGSVMTSYLLVGCRADRGNPDKRKSNGASKKQASNWYQSFDLVERDLNGGTVTLPMSGAP